MIDILEFVLEKERGRVKNKKKNITLFSSTMFCFSHVFVQRTSIWLLVSSASIFYLFCKFPYLKRAELKSRDFFLWKREEYITLF